MEPCPHVVSIVESATKIEGMSAAMEKLTSAVEEINRKMWTTTGVIIAITGCASFIAFVTPIVSEIAKRTLEK